MFCIRNYKFQWMKWVCPLKVPSRQLEHFTSCLFVSFSLLFFSFHQPIVNAKVTKEESAWREFVKNSHSIIQNMFFGQIRSTVKCCSCQYESATYEGFSNLSLELPQNSRQCYLADCLDLYFNGESIDGWECPQCKSKRGAVKKLDISRLPLILVIHFKRYVRRNKSV